LSFSYDWGRYRDCETYIQKLSGYLVDKYPNKIGANIYKDFNSIEILGAD
jgi:Fe-S cluster biosynthesis and repair protein YggX